jgi:hypothetical protein
VANHMTALVPTMLSGLVGWITEAVGDPQVISLSLSNSLNIAMSVAAPAPNIVTSVATIPHGRGIKDSPAVPERADEGDSLTT